MNQPISPPRYDHTDPHRQKVTQANDDALSISGPLHYQPPRDVAERLSATVRMCAVDETDRQDLLRMLLERPRPWSDKQRQAEYDKRCRAGRKPVGQ